MKAFAALLDALVFTPGRNAKIRLLQNYFKTTPDPDRGYGLGALAGALSFATVKPSLIRKLATERVDAELFALSYDFVGDLAETTALIWPGEERDRRGPPLSEIVKRVSEAARAEVPGLTADWLDGLDAGGRYALLKFLTGGLRAGVSARLTKVALAEYGQVSVNDIEEVWHGLSPPYVSLFSWLEGRSARPAMGAGAVFRPLMLANPLDEDALADLHPADFMAEWKWDGIRVQLVGGGGDKNDSRIFSRGADDITASFPDVAEHLAFDAVLDGELLVVRDGEVAPFNDLQQRLGRKTVSAAARALYPCHVKLYDILMENGADLRPLPLAERRRRLEAWFERCRPERMDLSPLVAIDGWETLSGLRASTRAAGIEGLMLKRKDSAYVAGRPKGPWFKLKRDPLIVDCVLMYAQRGHGKRSSFYSDFTFGCWRDDGEGSPGLVPVGKAYFGFTDKELAELDKWVRAHTVDRFGPVRAVSPGLVLEIAFDSVHRSPRHKSGLAMRFPRVHRIRWDKPAAEADQVETLEGLVAG